MKSLLTTILLVGLVTGRGQITGTCSRDVDTPGILTGSRLVGSVYLLLQTPNLQDCVKSCLQQFRCVSFNYKAGQCELNYDDATTAPSGLEASSGWNHASGLHFPSRLAGICSSKPCGENEMCRDKGGSYECEPEELCYTSSTPYLGTLNITNTGRTCQRWDTDTPHTRYYFPRGMSAGDPALVNESNYCRMPGHSVPWCYTMDPSVRWEDCSVPSC
ncbi:apolipoprotein(a)-like [Haliotis rubra]|uniref:apolipoprotein(a)-like n=1 Tax=Haliotis rubra TaxID=36100 RepID=UPI001EE55088|nr:apolipoprotein(a)-like [Haliotis rubra]